MSYRIAIIEDEAAIRDNYAEALTRQGYRVEAYPDRPAAEHAMSTSLPDLAIIDIGLGQEIDGGFALCQWLRARSERISILFLSARDSDFDVVSGLRMGADDYLTKDISLPHLAARVAALFRRNEALAQNRDAEDEMERGALRIDASRMECHWRDQPVPLTITEFWMVHALARHPGHVKSRDQLMAESRLVVDDTTITSHIKRIRRKFSAADPEFDGIDTVYGMGYRWNDTPVS